MPNIYTGQKRIKEVIYHILAPTLEKQGWYLTKIILDWNIIIGHQWRDDIWPTRFSPSFKNKSTGTLYLKATHKGLQQAQFMKGMLIEKINLYLGATAITDIKVQLWHRITAFPKITTKHPLISLHCPAVQDIQSEPLRNALMSLANSLDSSLPPTITR